MYTLWAADSIDLTWEAVRRVVYICTHCIAQLCMCIWRFDGACIVAELLLILRVVLLVELCMMMHVEILSVHEMHLYILRLHDDWVKRRDGHRVTNIHKCICTIILFDVTFDVCGWVSLWCANALRLPVKRLTATVMPYVNVTRKV
jgi:hypothetical protein